MERTYFRLVLLLVTVGLVGCRVERDLTDVSAHLRVTDLRIEYKQNPIGIDAERPRLSWQIQSSARGVLQSAYQIRVAEDMRDVREGRRLLFDSGKVASDQSIHLPYGGPPLESRQRYYWQVRIWNESGMVTAWSEPAFWEMGLLSKQDWHAQWIQPPFDENPLKPTPAPMLRSEFQLRGDIARARAYVTGLGVYELYLNGERVGDELFTPGWTSYEYRLQYQTYDVTALLKSGPNAVGAILGDGWYRRESFQLNGRRNNGKPFALLMQIEVTYRSGRRQTIVSSSDWKAATGPILFSELYNGEAYDARLERAGWTTARYDDHDWSHVSVATPVKGNLIAAIAPPVRRIQEVKPVRIFKSTEGVTLVDMGQMMAGWVRLRARGSAGTTITLRHAEVLDGKGNLYTENLRTAQQQVRYTLKGEGEEIFEPHFTIQGFRYIAVEGYPGELKPASVTGIVIHSDMERTGTLETSNDLINRLYENIVWTQKANHIDVPTDCPQRDERLGWSFDAQIFSATGALNMNTAGFFSKWLADFAAEQTPDGSVPWEIPRTLSAKIPLNAFLQSGGIFKKDERIIDATGAPGSSDAIITIPWNMYLAYGDVQILSSLYPSMTRWVQYVRGRAGSDYIWSEDFTFGDWLDTVSTKKPIKFGATSDDLFATAYYARSVYILGRVAKLLGKYEDAARYSVLFAHIREAFQKRFVSTDGRLSDQTQTAYVLALDFDLLPDSLRQLAARWLAEDVRSRGQLTTGIAGTQHILSVLSRFGYNEEAYLLLNRREMPSWLYPITEGATTIWERWDGIRPDGSFQSADMNSLNHYALGAIGEWLYGVMGGMTIDVENPGYKHSLIQPKPGGGLSRVKASLKTMYGRLSSDWQLHNGQFVLAIEVPPNTRSTVRLPRALLTQVREGRRQMQSVVGIIGQRQENDDVLLEVSSGRYLFTYPWKASAAEDGREVSAGPKRNNRVHGSKDDSEEAPQ